MNEPDDIRDHVLEIAQYYKANLNKLIQKRTWSLAKRILWLKCLGRLLLERRDSILKTVSAEKHCSEHNVMLGEYLPVRMLIKQYLSTATKVLQDKDRSKPLSLMFGIKKAVVRKEPLGTVGIISPFNFPFALPIGPIVSAFLGGNAVLFKPAEETPETNSLISHLVLDSLEQSTKLEFQLFEMLPTEVEYGKALVACPEVDKIHFTGSVQAGRAIMKANAEVRFVPVTLELGGSNAAIVLEDADLDEAAAVISFARFSGLNCNSIKRVFAVAEIYGILSDKLLHLSQTLSDHEIITSFSSRETNNFIRFIDDTRFCPALKESVQTKSVQPTIVMVDSYDRTIPALNEETFCPVLPIVKVKNQQEAIRCANDIRFGLGATVFTKNSRRFRKVASELNVGGVYHNDALTEFAQSQLPFGGTCDSGWSYTHGSEGLLDFVKLKSIVEERRFLTYLTRFTGRLFGIKYLHRLQLYPWTKTKMKWLKRFADTIIRFS